MSFDTFKNILDKIPRVLTQVAFGIGDIDANPDLFEMFRYCRKKEIIPNLTINGWRMTDELYENLMNLCGAVAVSHYDNDVCLDTVSRLSKKLGMEQINIHKLLCEDTYESCIDLIMQYGIDVRLDKLNAIVFLLMKPKGKRNDLKQLKDMEKYKKLIKIAFDYKVPIGFDSCSAPSFLRAVEERDNFKSLEQLAEPCESDCFSSYVNVDGMFFHCSFTEGQDGWEGVNIVECQNFLKDVWNSDEVKKFRNSLLEKEKENGCRSCPIFDLEMK